MKNVSFIKRLVVIVYDGLLVFGVTLVGYAVLFTFMSFAPEGFESSTVGKIIKVLYLILTTYGFYAWFWTHGGQTLGMKAWNLYLLDNDGKFINWKVATLRYFIAVISWLGVAGALYFADVERWYLAIGLGFSWCLVDKHNLTWHDLLTRTQIIYKSKS